MNQFNLFEEVLDVYKNASAPVSNEALYSSIKSKAGKSVDFDKKEPIGKSGEIRSVMERRIRWAQQTLKQSGVISKVEGERGVWAYTNDNGKGLHEIMPEYSMLGFSTKYGMAILGKCENVFSKFNEPVHLVFTSPPYPLAKARKYGNVSEKEYVDWLCKTLDPLIKNLADGASLAINLGNDIFVPGTPARSSYKERLIIALEDRYGLSLMDNLIWHNLSKPPGPIQWASKQRMQLNTAYENIIWMCNNPLKCFANNKRVLQPHTEKHMKFVLSGGETRNTSNSDGAYMKKPGYFSKVTEGKIPRNVISMGHSCADQRAYRNFCKSKGIVTHGASMPLKLAEFIIQFMTEVGHTVADPFGGSMTTGKAAEVLQRLWIATDMMVEYIMGASSRFSHFEDYQYQLN